MQTLISYLIQAFNVIMDKGLFLKFSNGTANISTNLKTILTFILCFFALILVLKKLYRW